ncbi:MAG: ABC transporter permease subunit [Planctomycetes bacterium]|nr:ABC transporter permease subunit [Planctomycetota bacterium]
MMRAVRGGPFDSERALSPAIEANLKARYHLDWPLWKQYAAYVGPLELGEQRAAWLGGDGTRVFGGVLAGDFGPSFRYRDTTVNDILAQSLPISLALGGVALAFALVLGLAAGLVSAQYPRSSLDTLVRTTATIGIAVPNFVIAGFLVILFAFLVPLFPVAGYGSWEHMVLPGCALGLPFAAYIARLTRAGMLDALSFDWIRTARAKGVPPRTILLRHALRAGIVPVVSYLGPATAGILTGSLVIERIFAIPGTGSHFVNSALNRDYTLAMGVTILYTTLVCGLNVLVDVLYTWLDPRVALEEEG